MLLEHLADMFPRHIQIHYGQYERGQLFEAARRSRACAYLADDDHGPLALQEIAGAIVHSMINDFRNAFSHCRLATNRQSTERLP